MTLFNETLIERMERTSKVGKLAVVIPKEVLDAINESYKRGALAGARAMQACITQAISLTPGIDRPTVKDVVLGIDPAAVARAAVGAQGEIEPESNIEGRQQYEDITEGH